MTITDTMRTVWKYLTKYMTPEGAAGVMGNLYAESGVQPVCLENLCIKRYKERQGKIYTSATYAALVDDGTISRAEFISPMGYSYGWGWAILTVGALLNSRPTTGKQVSTTSAAPERSASAI